MNAIILAAGMGMRLRPLTNDKPKCLVPVNGVPMVERQIQFLHEAGITDITLVSGYKAEKLDYLKEKYGVDIIFNDKFDVCNNIYSMYLARNKFKNTFAIDGDTFLNKNCFLEHPSKSTYFSRRMPSYTNEWELIVDENNDLQKIEVNSKAEGGLIISGVSYWEEKDSKIIVSKIEKAIENRDYTNLFWDDMVIENSSSMDIHVEQFDDIFEIDTEKDLLSLEHRLNK